jgi:hypothetical protein
MHFNMVSYRRFRAIGGQCHGPSSIVGLMRFCLGSIVTSNDLPPDLHSNHIEIYYTIWPLQCYCWFGPSSYNTLQYGSLLIPVHKGIEPPLASYACPAIEHRFEPVLYFHSKLTILKHTTRHKVGILSRRQVAVMCFNIVSSFAAMTFRSDHRSVGVAASGIATILKYTGCSDDRYLGWTSHPRSAVVLVQAQLLTAYNVFQYDRSYRPRPPTACNCSPISRQSAPVVRQRSSSAWPSGVSDPWGRTVWPKPATPQATKFLIGV